MKFLKDTGSWFVRVIGNIPTQIVMAINWLYGFVSFFLLNKVLVVGKKNLPKGTGILLLSNHLTLIDSWAIGAALYNLVDVALWPSRMPYNIPDSDNFTNKWYKRLFFGLSKTIPVSRKHLGKKNPIDEWGQKLKNSNLVLFFEAGRNKRDDLKIVKCSPGTVRLIREHYIKQQNIRHIVPIRLVKLEKIRPLEKSKKIMLWHLLPTRFFQRAYVIVGKPMEFSSEADKTEIAQTIRQTVSRLYHDEAVRSSEKVST